MTEQTTPIKTGKFSTSELQFIKAQLAKSPPVEPEKIALALNRAVRPIKGMIAKLKAESPIKSTLTEEQQFNAQLFQDELQLPQWAAEFLVTSTPIETMPEHALKLATSVTCYLTGAPLTEDRSSNYGAVYIPEDDIIVCRLAARVKGEYPAKDFVKLCALVARSARIDA